MQCIEIGDVDGAPVAEEHHQYRQADGRLGGRDGEDEEHEHLTGQVAEEMREGDEVHVHGEQHQLDGHEQDDDAISVRAGDELFDGMQIDVLKMDVEGMEIGALKGLKATIARCKPTMFIEVDTANLDAFHALMDDYGYDVVHAFKATRVNQNFLLKPKAV